MFCSLPLNKIKIVYPLGLLSFIEIREQTEGFELPAVANNCQGSWYQSQSLKNSFIRIGSFFYEKKLQQYENLKVVLPE